MAHPVTITPEAYKIMSVIRACIRDPARAAELKSATAEQFAGAHGLSVDAAADVLGARVDRLVATGVNPIFMIYLSRLLGFDLQERYGQLATSDPPMVTATP